MADNYRAILKDLIREVLREELGKQGKTPADYRQERGLTREELVDLVNADGIPMHISTIQYYEDGRVRNLEERTVAIRIRKIAEKLNVPLTEYRQSIRARQEVFNASRQRKSRSCVEV